MNKFILYLSACLFINGTTFAQDDLLDDLLDEGQGPQYATSTFKSTRILAGHSIEQTHHGELSFRISHRFGRLNSGIQELYGLDQATIHFSFEYGVVPWLMVGVGRSNYKKTYDGFAKANLLKQSTGKKVMPVHLSYFTSFEANTQKTQEPEIEAKHRFNYVHQLLVARKFNERLSLQLTPTFIHRNLVDDSNLGNDIYSLGMGGRFKLTDRFSINSEIFIVPEEQLDPNTYIPFALGFDLETGGHVFQLIFTNALSMREAGFITETTGDWFAGDIHFGFNISRVFNIVNK